MRACLGDALVARFDYGSADPNPFQAVVQVRLFHRKCDGHLDSLSLVGPGELVFPFDYSRTSGDKDIPLGYEPSERPQVLGGFDCKRALAVLGVELCDYQRPGLLEA